MRAFVVFATLLAVALARPDIGLKLREQGYNYQNPGHSSGGSSGGGSHNELLRRKSVGGGGSGGSRVEPSLFQGISSYEAPLVSGNSFNGGGGGHGSSGGHNGGHGSSGNGGNYGQSSSGFSSGSSGFGGSNGGSSFGGSSGGFSGPSSSSGFGGSNGFSSGGSGFGGSSGGSGFGGSSGGSGFGGSSGGSGFGGSSGSSGFGGSSGGSGFGGSSGSGGDVTQGHSQVIDISGGSPSGRNVVYKNVVKQGEPIVTKHFYVHEAPEEEENAQVEERVQTVRPQKNYKIIFIKAPSQPNPFSRANYPVFPQNEEKTIVYVLSKKNEGPGEDGEIPTPPPAVTSKPEVFFVKYKTKEEAEQAVAKIQDSFQEGGPGYESPAAFAESLGAQGGGASSSSFSSGGSNYRGDEESLDVRGSDSGHSSGGHSSGGHSSGGHGGSTQIVAQQMLELPQADFQSEYLPPNKRQAKAKRQG